MKLFRCRSCRCGFAIFTSKRGKSNASAKAVSAKSITCPLCKASEVDELDPIESIGGALAKKAIEFWSKLPSE
mgnify:FL=1